MVVRELRKALERGSTEYKVLTLLIRECEEIEERGLTADPVAIARKFIKSNQDTLKFGANSTLEAEIVFLETLLPTQLTEDDIVSLIMEQGITSLGTAMKFLKENYAEEYDGRVAAAAIKRCL
jgi:uncharacterized protein YqeY